MNDVETIQRERGWRECGFPAGRNYWTSPITGIHQRYLPDPLADTSEGWWEFGQIAAWRDKWCTERGAFWSLISCVLLDDEQSWGYEMVIFMLGETTYSAKHADERAAIIAALAAAVRHESEATG